MIKVPQEVFLSAGSCWSSPFLSALLAGSTIVDRVVHPVLLEDTACWVLPVHQSSWRVQGIRILTGATTV